MDQHLPLRQPQQGSYNGGPAADDACLFAAIYENEADGVMTETQLDEIFLKVQTPEFLELVRQRYSSSIYGSPANQTASVVTNSKFAAGLPRFRDAISQTTSAAPV